MFRFTLASRWAYFPAGGGDPRKGREVFFDRLFTKFKEDVGDYAPAFHKIADLILEPLVQKTFKTEKAELTWQDLAESTIARRGSAHPILRVSGLLQDSFKKGEAMHHEEIDAKHMVWGSDVPYALFHQTGTGAGFTQDRLAPGSGRGMARRRELYLTARTRTSISSVITAHMAEIARRVGFKTLGRNATPLEARAAGEQMLGG